MKKYLILPLIIILISLFIPVTFVSADAGNSHYWVGGDGNWNDPAHWSHASGGAGGAGVPDATNNVIFDDNGGASVITININVDAYCLNFDFSGPGSKDFELIGSNDIYVYGNLYLNHGDYLDNNWTGDFYLKATAAKTIDIGDGIFDTYTVANDFIFNGVGGSWQLSDDLDVKSITLINGTLDTNGKYVTLDSDFITSAGTNVLTLGASVVYVDNDWDARELDTLNSGTSNITVGADFYGNGKTYYDVLLSFVASGDIVLSGANSFHDLDIENNNVYDKVIIYNNQTITGTFTATGFSATNRLAIVGYGSARQITAAVVSSTHTDYAYITGAGAGDWDLSSAPEDSIDFGNNSNIDFTFPYDQLMDYYWTGKGSEYAGTGSGNWTWWNTGDINITGYDWSTTSGGSGGAARLPLPRYTNNVYFDANSGIAAGNNDVYFLGTTDHWECKDLDLSGLTYTPDFNIPVGKYLIVYGNLTIYPGMDIDQIQLISSAIADSTLTSGNDLGVTAPNQPGNLYSEGNTGGLMGLQDLVDPALTMNDIPVEMFWYPIAFVAAIVSGYAIYGKTRNLMAQAITSALIMAIFCGGGVLGDGLLPYWTVLLFAGEAGAIILLQEKQVL